MNGETKRRVAILYFSGTGGTELVAELLGELLSERLECRVAGIDDPRSREYAAAAEALVLCYPTYYLKPAPSMREFAETLGPFDPPRKAYVVTTCELYTENSIRRLALVLRKRGMIVAGSKAVHAPGSDVTLVFPSALIPWWYRFERGISDKLCAIAREVAAVAIAADVREAIPRAKWYTPFTWLLQILFFDRFDIFRGRLRVLEDRCASCGACVELCGRGAWTMGASGPVHDPERCELCGRCLHRCPNRAIVLLKALRNNRRLDPRLYAALGDEAKAALGIDAKATR